MANGTPDRESIQAALRAARRTKIPPIDIEIPGYDGTLWGTFKIMRDFEEAYEISERHEHAATPARQALLSTVDTLVSCCVGTFVPQDGFVASETHGGDRFELGMGLGVDLAQFLGVEGADAPALTDAAAVFLIFDDGDGPNTVAIGNIAARLAEHARTGGRHVEVELAGNSPAPSSPSSEQPAPSSESLSAPTS